MIYAYYDYVSITSGVLLLIIALVIVLGATHGFLTKFINMANAICGLLFSILFCSKFSDVAVEPLLKNYFFDKFYNNAIESEAASNFVSSETGLQDFLKELGLPSFIADSINVDTSSTVQKICTQIADLLSNIVCIIIAFLILFFGLTLLCKLLKLIVNGLRESKAVRIIDGILGVIFYLVLGYIGICIGLLVLSLVIQHFGNTGFSVFMINDMSLTTDKFKISKWFYENNIIGNFIKMFI